MLLSIKMTSLPFTKGTLRTSGGGNFKKSANIGNKSKKRHKRLILILKLGSEASKNKVSNNQKSIKHINELSRCK